MTHAELNDYYELYLLGAAEPEVASEIETHLTDQCAHCLERLQEAVTVTAAMSGIVEPQKPPKRLRKRVLASVRPEKRRVGWMFAAAALGTACAGLLVFSLWSGGQLGRLRAELSSLQGERNQLRAAVDILSKSGTKTVDFGVAENAPHGRVFVNRAGGLVFVGSQLPALASDRTFELWLIPAKGAPQPAGLFRPNERGSSVNVSHVAADPTRFTAVAVSVEPREGSTTPTTKPILVVPLA